LKQYVFKAVYGMMYTDALSAMYYATATREIHKGLARRLADHYLGLFMNGDLPLERDSPLQVLSRAVAEFNTVETVDRDYPKAGIVGEIYVKYNSFSNNEVAHWLMSQEVEVIVPPMLEFFAGSIIAQDHGVKTFVKRPGILWLLALWGRGVLNKYLNEFDQVMKDFRHYRPHHNIREIARKAEELVTLNHQYGEGWLIAGEVATFVEEGVPNVLCLQPFGCIANHVVAKGVQKRIKERYLEVNLIFLDADAGVSEVNFFNCMHFFVDHAKKAHKTV
jgi:predicted nucleotide-binding protein (sugar kinase/HSP70/actin superfamily)